MYLVRMRIAVSRPGKDRPDLPDMPVTGYESRNLGK